MGLLSRFRNSDPPEERVWKEEWEKLCSFLGYDSGELDRSKLTSSTYYACMLIRCNAIAKLPLKLMRESEKGSQKATEHPAYQIMKLRPNPFTSTHDFLWATEFQKLEYGNAFWVPSYSRGSLHAVYLLDSANMEIVVDDTAILDEKNDVYYVYSDPQKGSILYRSDQILHFKNFSGDGITGTSIKKYLSDVIESEQYGRKLIKSRNKDGLQDPLIVTYTGDLNDEKRRKIQKRFSDLGGAKNAGKVVPIPTDFTVKQLETKMVNNQFFELQGLTTRQIANAFGVKGFQLNDMEKSTYNNIEQQNRAFYSDTLQNVLTAYEQEMDFKLLPSWEQGRYYWEFNVDAILRSNLESRYRAYQTGIAGGFLKISEAREKENLPFEKDTDQLIIGNGASIPLSQLGNQYQNTQKGGEGD